MKESDVQKGIKEYLTRFGWFCFKVHQQGFRVHKGISDLIAIKNGKVVFIEVKTDTGELSDDQARFMVDIQSKGGNYIVARSIEDVMKI